MVPLVLQRSGLVFFHMPKTGGTWVRTAAEGAGVACEMIGGIHCGCEEYGAVLNGFTIIRHPWAWYQSMWAHDRVWGGELWDSRRLGVKVNEDINSWACRIIQQWPAYMTRCHLRYVADNVTVIRTEQLTDNLIDLLNEAGEQFDADVLRSTPRINEAGSLPIMVDAVELSEETQCMIRQSDREIFDQYYPEA